MSFYIAVIGLGYVGLPVAVAFGKHSQVIGFDIHEERLVQLRKGEDKTLEVSSEDLASSQILYTSSLEDLRKANFYIITVPTPIDQANIPDLTPLKKASETVGKVLKKGDIVVYESTVYPGATEEVCLPILEKNSLLKGGIDFKLGYSPERINPGDKEHTFTKIKKVVSAQDTESLDHVASVYSKVVTAGVFKASSIKVAEAAKVIENIQRDINIAFMNELALLFSKLEIDTLDVLEAAQTKWNFLPFRPGFVGGHCIGVDPYYLTYKAEEVGYHPQIILSGRRINNMIPNHIATCTVQQMLQAGHSINDSVVTILGLTFKENCPDIRNTKVVNLIHELQKYNIKIQICDPWASPLEVQEEYGLSLIPFEELTPAHSIIMAVSHHQFKVLTKTQLFKLGKENAVFMDVKGMLNRTEIKEMGFNLWRI